MCIKVSEMKRGSDFLCKISVVVPVYNVEKTVGKCLRSILGQTFTDIEVIVVNDGTTDNSMEVIERYTIDQRVKVITKENGGLPQARKTGFLQAQGEYIFFVDSDDWIEKNALECLYTAIQTTDADIACCNFVIDYDDLSQSELGKVEKVGKLSRQEGISGIHNMNTVFVYVWNKLYRKSAIMPEDFPESNFIGEDYCTIISIISRANRIVQIEKPLYHYMQYCGSMTKMGFGIIHVEAYKQYRRIRTDLLKQYPEKKKEIIAFHLLQEMGILNAMFRNDTYDAKIRTKLIVDIKENCITFLCNCHMRFLYKGAVFMTAISWKLYRAVYRFLYKKTQTRYL